MVVITLDLCGKTYRESPQKQVVREQVKECFHLNRRRYGSRRIAAALKIGRLAAHTAMKREGLQAITPKKFKPNTTDSNHDQRISPNLLKKPRDQPMGKGEVLVGDITYLPLPDGKFC